MAHAMPKRGHGLSTQNAPRCIGHGAADDQRQALTAGLEIFFNRKQGRFGIECVENRFNQQHIATAFDQSLGLLVVSLSQLFKCDIACASIVHIGADAGGLGRGA